MALPPVSLQLYSVREDTARDFAGTVAALARMGFAGVETAGYGNTDAAGAARALADAGLRCSGMHVSLAALRADLTKVVLEARQLGTTHVICPWLPRELFTTAAACVTLAEELDALGARLRAWGLQLSYHNHAWEFTAVEGRLAIDWMLDASSPRNLACEADLYWVHHAGADAVKFLREQGRRVRLVHLKDQTELGTGPLDYRKVFPVFDDVDALEWQVIEVEWYNHAPMESARLSLEQLRRWGRA